MVDTMNLPDELRSLLGEPGAWQGRGLLDHVDDGAGMAAERWRAMQAWVDTTPVDDGAFIPSSRRPVAAYWVMQGKPAPRLIAEGSHVESRPW